MQQPESSQIHENVITLKTLHWLPQLYIITLKMCSVLVPKYNTNSRKVVTFFKFERNENQKTIFYAQQNKCSNWETGHLHPLNVFISNLMSLQVKRILPQGNKQLKKWEMSKRENIQQLIQKVIKQSDLLHDQLETSQRWRVFQN